ICSGPCGAAAATSGPSRHSSSRRAGTARKRCAAWWSIQWGRRAVMQQFRQITAVAPDELCCLLILRRAPAVPYLPPGVHGRPCAAIAVWWAGDPGDGRAAVLPLKTFARPLADTIERKPFVEHQTMLDAGQPFGRRYYWKSHYFAEIGDDLIDAMIEHAERITSPHSAALLMHLGGTPARLDPSM